MCVCVCLGGSIIVNIDNKQVCHKRLHESSWVEHSSGHILNPCPTIPPPLFPSPPFDSLSNFCSAKAVHINQALNQAEGQKATQPTIWRISLSSRWLINRECARFKFIYQVYTEYIHSTRILYISSCSRVTFCAACAECVVHFGKLKKMCIAYWRINKMATTRW